MGIFNYFRDRKKDSAAIAKERLQILVAHQRNRSNQPDFLPAMQQELLEVIRKYMPISRDQVQVSLDDQEGCSILELNITLPDR